MKEIGGYLELGGFFNKAYHDKAIALNTATNAIIYLVKAKKINKLYVPYYMCDCLDKVKNYCEIEYYRINKDFTPNFNIKLKSDEYLYVVNFFGMFDNSDIEKYKEEYNNIIVDNVQAFFQMPVSGVDTVYTCRKFFGVPDGAYLYTNTKLEEDIPEDKSKERFSFLLGRLEEDASSNFGDYKKNEEVLLNLDLAYMSKLTKLILNAIDYETIKEKRSNNFKYLNEKLKDSNGLTLKNIEGAYMYPYYTENAEILRKRLIENKIYIPILWPNVLEQDKNTLEYNYANNIILIPCDQRYDINDMQYILDLLSKFKQ